MRVKRRNVYPVKQESKSHFGWCVGNQCALCLYEKLFTNTDDRRKPREEKKNKRRTRKREHVMNENMNTESTFWCYL